jgi:hypothetical protein
LEKLLFRQLLQGQPDMASFGIAARPTVDVYWQLAVATHLTAEDQQIPAQPIWVVSGTMSERGNGALFSMQ